MDETRRPAGDDTATETAVLSQLLFLHPTQVSLEELIRGVAGDADDFGERDAVERAVRELAMAGLLRRVDELVLPTLAALRFDRLLG